MGKKKLFQNPLYAELAPADGSRPRPGTFFYGPILFEVDVVATVRPVMRPDRSGYSTTRQGTLLFDVEMPLPPDAFRCAAGFPSVIKPFEELVAVPGKMRPVVILSPEAANGASALVVPSFKIANLPEDEQEAVRHGESVQRFHLPACPQLAILESVLDLKRLQAVRLKGSLFNAGNRPAGDPHRSFVGLTVETLDRLRAQLDEFLTA